MFRPSQYYIFASCKVLLTIVKVNAAQLHNNYNLIVETNLSHLLNLYIDYFKKRVVQNRLRVLRTSVVRMVLHNDLTCIIAVFWAQVAIAPISHGAATANVNATANVPLL